MAIYDTDWFAYLFTQTLLIQASLTHLLIHALTRHFGVINVFTFKTTTLLLELLLKNGIHGQHAPLYVEHSALSSERGRSQYDTDVRLTEK